MHSVCVIRCLVLQCALGVSNAAVFSNRYTNSVFASRQNARELTTFLACTAATAARSVTDLCVHKGLLGLKVSAAGIRAHITCGISYISAHWSRYPQFYTTFELRSHPFRHIVHFGSLVALPTVVYHIRIWKPSVSAPHTFQLIGRATHSSISHSN